MKNLQQTLLAMAAATTTALNATVDSFPPMPDVNTVNCTATPEDCANAQNFATIIALSLAAIGVTACCVAKKCQTKGDQQVSEPLIEQSEVGTDGSIQGGKSAASTQKAASVV